MPKVPRTKSAGRIIPGIIPFVKGFRPPTENQKLRAIGSESLSSAFSTAGGHFNDIPKCTSVDDWLAQYKEPGQTYEDFLQQCPWLYKRKMKYVKHRFVAEGEDICSKYPEGVIYVMPLGSFTEKDSVSPDFDRLIEYTQIFFDLPVKRLPAVELECKNGSMYWVNVDDNGDKWNTKLKSRYHRETGHYQLCLDGALSKLRSCIPHDALCLMALTSFDLYEETPDLFVAGMAAGNQRIAIFSLNRYDPNLEFSTEHWYDISRKKKHSAAEATRLVLQRSCRLLVHEIAHLLGVDHCIFFECCMNGSGHLSEDFRQPMHLCPVDLRKLQRLCGFDVLERYDKLQKFYEQNRLEVESKWCMSRLEFIRR